MFGVLVFLFTVVPAFEIYLLFKIGGAIGGMNTFLVVVLTGVLGAALAKSQKTTESKTSHFLWLLSLKFSSVT